MFCQSIAITIFYFQLNLWFVEGKKGEGYRETEQSKTILKKAADILKCKPSELNKLKYIGAELKENRDMLIFHLRWGGHKRLILLAFVDITAMSDSND